MNLAKAALKLEVAQSMAAKLEAIEEAAARDAQRLDGGAEALRQAAGALDSHRAYYQDAVDSGDLTGPECTLAMQVITKCVGGLQSLLDKTTLAKQLKAGQLHGIRQSIDLLEKDFQAERKRLEAVVAGMEHDGRPDQAAQDIAQRRQQAQAEQADQPEAPKRKAKSRKKAAKKTARKAAA